MALSVLEEVQRQLADKKISDEELRKMLPSLQVMHEKIQALKRERIAAIKKAQERAAKPYDKAMKELEERYAMLAKMAG